MFLMMHPCCNLGFSRESFQKSALKWTRFLMRLPLGASFALLLTVYASLSLASFPSLTHDDLIQEVQNDLSVSRW